MQQEAKHKKTLHLKIAFVVIFSTFSPFILGLFIHLTPLFILLVAAVSASCSIAILLWVLRPLGNLIESTKTFSDGNLNHRIDIRSGDEFEEAGNSFNLMAEKLSKTIQSMESERAIAIAEKNKFDEILSSIIDGIIALDFNKNIIFLNKASEQLTGYNQTEVQGKSIDQVIHLFSDTDEILSKTYCRENFNQTAKLIGKMGKQTKVKTITTQVSTTVQTNLSCIIILHDLSREEELEQMKLDFVSMASHELKTPLTSIVGYLSVFLEENQKNISKESFNLLNKAFTAAKQLQTLITNLLNVNKIEREQLSVSPEPTDHLAILAKVVDDLRSLATQKSIVLNLSHPAQTLPKVLADPIRLSEVVTNLVANAINYTNPGGKVEIAVKVSPVEVETVVSDTGIGIPKEAIPHLFNKFFRVSNTEQKANKGTGLGLYISKSIIEKLHGKIWVESEPGKGSKFLFTLPVVTQSSGILDSRQFTSQAFQSGTLNY
ncbi:PAS domain S-box protein [Candidatus Daviesbacteria bacterium]|nr:PAS domain S-box protein [Candidatus Daviesbacteria bacterium]